MRTFWVAVLASATLATAALAQPSSPIIPPYVAKPPAPMEVPAVPATSGTPVDEAPISAAPAQAVPPPAPSAPAASTPSGPPAAAGAPTANPPPAEDEDEKPKTFNAVTLRALNKVTARAVTLDMPFGTVEHFGTLEIVARACRQSAPGESPDNAALLDVSEIKPGEATSHIFTGWMFSSSPGLSALEHPVYDLTVVTCTNRDPKEAK